MGIITAAMRRKDHVLQVINDIDISRISLATERCVFDNFRT